MKKYFVSILITLIVTLFPLTIFAQVKYYEYKPALPDYGSLQKSVQMNEKREKDAYDAYEDLCKYIGTLRSKIVSQYSSEFNSIINPIINNIESCLKIGDYATARKRAVSAKGELAMSESIDNLIKKSKEKETVNIPEKNVSAIEKVKTSIDGINFGDNYNDVLINVSKRGVNLTSGNNWIEVNVNDNDVSTVYFGFQYKDGQYILSRVAWNFFTNSSIKAKAKRETIKGKYIETSQNNNFWSEGIDQNGFKYYYRKEKIINDIILGINKEDNKKYDVFLIYDKIY